MEAFVCVACGNNPVKTTRAEKVPLNNKKDAVVWNEPLDIECRSSDSVILIQVMDYDKDGADDVVGTASIPMTELFTSDVRWKFGWESVSSPPGPLQYKLLYDGKHAGVIWCSFYLTKPGHPLPTVLAHTAMPDGDERTSLMRGATS